VDELTVVLFRNDSAENAPRGLPIRAASDGGVPGGECDWPESYANVNFVLNEFNTCDGKRV